MSGRREIGLAEGVEIARSAGQQVSREWLRRRLCIEKGWGRKTFDGWLLDYPAFQAWLQRRAQWKGL